MLTLDMLLAVMQGLPASQLVNLDVHWQNFCRRIEFAMDETNDPLAALLKALDQATAGELRRIERALNEALAVKELQDLSARQKELLIALRYSRAASLSHLHKLLNWDRSNTYRCLASLMNKGYVGKFYGAQGPNYFAIERKLKITTKLEAFGLIKSYIEYLNRQDSSSVQPSSVGNMTTMTTLTTKTTPTTLTTRQKPIAGSTILDLRLQPAPVDTG